MRLHPEYGCRLLLSMEIIARSTPFLLEKDFFLTYFVVEFRKSIINLDFVPVLVCSVPFPKAFAKVEDAPSCLLQVSIVDNRNAMKNRLISFSFLLLGIMLLLSSPLQARGIAICHAQQHAQGLGNDWVGSMVSAPSAQLLLIPRVMEAEKVALEVKQLGTIVYQIDAKVGYWMYDGKAWVSAPALATSTWKVATADATGWNLVNEKGEKQVLKPTAGYRADALRSATSLSYAFKSWTHIYEERKAMTISRLKSMFPGIEQLDFEGQNVSVVFSTNTKSSEISEFFRMLGYNTIEALN